MKKIIFIFILSFIFIFNVKAYKFSIGDQVPNMYISRVSGSKYHNGAPFMLKRNDGAFVYCINGFEPNVSREEYSEYSYNNPIFNLSDEQLDRINVIAHYGYGYSNHSNLKWYGITQFLIWKELKYDDVYFTNVYHGNRATLYVDEVNEIENLVNNHYLLPSIANNNYKYTINSSYEINDLNNTLKDYQIIESNIDANILGDKLFINTKDAGKYEIKFIKKIDINQDYLLYFLNGSQPLIKPGKVKDIEFKITIEVISGSITINKQDSEDINREFATVEGATYGVFKNNILVDEITTDINGIANIQNLSLGKYIVKELNPSLGYSIDENIYEIDLTYDNKDMGIISKENIIKGDIELNKYYGFKDNYELENEAIFEIYDINDKFIGSYQTINGKINEKLDYGNYYVIQTKGINGYSFIDKFNISISEEKKYSFNLYDDILIVDVPNTGVSNYKYKLYPILFIIFGIALIIKSLKKTTQ